MIDPSICPFSSLSVHSFVPQYLSPLFLSPYRHVIFAPSSVNSYSGASFPGVVDSIFNATTLEDWNEVHHQLDIVAIHVRYATQIMNQPSVEWVN